MKTPNAVAKFIEFYENFDSPKAVQLFDVYADNIEFIDPFHKVSGLGNLSLYFDKMTGSIKNCQFEISQVFVDENSSAVIEWEMSYSHIRLNSGKKIVVGGISAVKFSDDKITYHRDYFDSSQMLYRYIPIIGSVIRFVEKRL